MWDFCRGSLAGVGALARIAAGSRLERAQTTLARRLAHFARPYLVTEVGAEPLEPVDPPRPLALLRSLEPGLGSLRQLLMGPIAVLLCRRRVDHAGDVARAGENEARLAAEQTHPRIGCLP